MKRPGIKKIIIRTLSFLLGTLAFTIVLYFVCSLFISTDLEKRLRAENRMYEEAFSHLWDHSEMLQDAIAGLQYKDNDIYGLVFHANAPQVDPMGSLDVYYASDTIPESRLASYTDSKADALLERTVAVDAAFGRILRTVASENYAYPPMRIPLDSVSYPQVGASMGQKINPFYKAFVFHSGIDFVVSRGTPVYATADGVVGEGTGHFRTLGNLVEIKHKSGYTTHYCHLDDMYVKRGQKVSRGQKIGTVGMTGKAYAPHLHYEVLKDGAHLDPVNYIFASVTPGEYANMLFMAVNTKQSMD